MTIRTSLKAGGRLIQHNETLQVRSALKAGAWFNHNEALRREGDRPSISMRREIKTTVRREDRLGLLVIRAGLRAGLRRPPAVRRPR